MINFSLLMGFSCLAASRRAARRTHENHGPIRVGYTRAHNKIEFRLEYLARYAQQQAGQQGAGKKEQQVGLVRGTHINKI
jgi:hypothetical protein